MKGVLFLFLLLLLSFISCKNREHNYILYYNKVNEIDSIYRFQKNTLKAVKKYRRLFRKYPPKNQERIKEFQTFITLADRNNKNFGGQKSLYKLILLLAPYGDQYKDFYTLFEKYGIDSIEVNQKVNDWKKSLNKQLIDSFNVAMVRDQKGRPSDLITVKKNVKKNAELLLWTFKNYGFPSVQKIGTFPMHTFLTHMNESEEYYPIIKAKLLEYIKSGDCPPVSYAMMFDSRHVFVEKGRTTYGFSAINTVMDSVEVNRNGKNIGLPSLQHSDKITKDFQEKMIFIISKRQEVTTNEVVKWLSVMKKNLFELMKMKYLKSEAVKKTSFRKLANRFFRDKE